MIAKMLVLTTMTMMVAMADNDEGEREDTDIHGDQHHQHHDPHDDHMVRMIMDAAGAGEPYNHADDSLIDDQLSQSSGL